MPIFVRTYSRVGRRIVRKRRSVTIVFLWSIFYVSTLRTRGAMFTATVVVRGSMFLYRIVSLLPATQCDSRVSSLKNVTHSCVIKPSSGYCTGTDKRHRPFAKYLQPYLCRISSTVTTTTPFAINLHVSCRTYERTLTRTTSLTQARERHSGLYNNVATAASLHIRHIQVVAWEWRIGRKRLLTLLNVTARV